MFENHLLKMVDFLNKALALGIISLLSELISVTNLDVKQRQRQACRGRWAGATPAGGLIHCDAMLARLGVIVVRHAEGGHN